MMAWLLNQWDRLRNSLWFVPALGLTAALAAAVLLLRVDASLRVESISALDWAKTTAPAARATLATLGGGLMTIAGVVWGAHPGWRPTAEAREGNSGRAVA